MADETTKTEAPETEPKAEKAPKPTAAEKAAAGHELDDADVRALEHPDEA